MTLQETDSPTIVAMLANATRTFFKCKGSRQAQRNKDLINSYKDELRQRRVELPKTADLLKMGVYEGEGSFKL